MCPMRNDVSKHINTGAARTADNHPQEREEGKEDEDAATKPVKKTSMGTLITWNITKALENDPQLDLKSAIRAAQTSLESSDSLSSVLSQTPTERHMACAVLAWQELGHSNTDSLYRFITNRLKEQKSIEQESVDLCQNAFTSCGSDKDVDNSPRNVTVKNPSTTWAPPPEVLRLPASPGPVLRLPMVEHKVVMRLDTKSQCRPATKKDVTSKIDSACCMVSSCNEKLQAVDKVTQHLRARAACLARREASRVETLERAEAAWRDLDAGYQRRLRMAQEKEEQIERQMAKLINERNEFKNACSDLVSKLSARTDAAERERQKLAELEDEVCKLACERVKLAEQAAHGDALLADELCKSAHMDRELLFREDQSRRRQMALEGDADAATALTHEAERALHAELCALKAQMEQAATELLLEDERATRLKKDLQELRVERDDLTEDLESCTVRCDARMQSQVDELKKKREELAGLRLKEMDCHCKLPIDVAVEVKRTPSVAALCQCSPEDAFLESCSCTSLRSRLISTLLSDLFSGLQSEFNIQDTQLPCQLLKCLEDKHNWDKSSAVKTRLREFFSKLLLGELDIAIATAIEKHHVRWVGESCVDTLEQLKPPPDCMHSEGWQERALEKKAQKMASELAQQLFKDKAKELAQQAQDILTESGRPACECHPSTCCPSPAGTYPCLVNPPKITISKTRGEDSGLNNKVKSRTHNEVSDLKKQIEELKKEIIKREDLNMMEEKIAKMFQLASGTSPVISMLDTISFTDSIEKKDAKNNKYVNNNALFRNNRATNRTGKLDNRKKQTDSITLPNKSSVNQNGASTGNKSFKRTAQQFAVNMCLLDVKNKSSVQNKTLKHLISPSISSCKHGPSKENVSSFKQIRPIKSSYTERSNFDDNKTTSKCKDNCICFHKKPSNTSIDKLLETLNKWKMDLEDSPVKLSIDKNEDTKSLVKTSQKCIGYTKTDCEPLLIHKISQNHDEDNSKVIIITHKSSNVLQETKPVSDHIQIINCISNDNRTDLPIPTESEYMGAINLDKSAENSCKCVVSGNYKKSIIEFPFKCIHSTSCACKGCSSVPVQQEQGNDTQSFMFNNLFPIENDTDLNRTAETWAPIAPNIQNNKMDDLEKDHFNDIFQSSAGSVAIHDNQIKCLGVTLSNINSTKKIRQKQIKDFENLSEKNKSDSQKDLNYISQPRKKVYKQLKPDRKWYKGISAYGHRVDVNEVEPDKEKESNKVDGSNDEFCICCKYDADDLEVNTFQLLEEHLKGKLEEFKNTFSIPDGDEEEIFTAILKRIKQLIHESTSSVTCKCIGTKEVKGSWKRAYSLLREYLKIKIERVKCQCESSKRSNQSELVLPNVLKNINHLIENDFQRLKEISIRKNANLSQEKNQKPHSELKPIQFPDKNNLKTELISEFGQMPITDKQGDNKSFPNNNSSKNPDVFTSNIAAQVSFYRTMETKSCNAMKKKSHYMEVQTIDGLRNILTIDGYNNARHSFDSCVIENSEKDMKQVPDVNEVLMAGEFKKGVTRTTALNDDSNLENHKPSETIRFIDSHTKDSPNIKEKCLKPALSYIGYTMDCNCDEDLGCVCTKSTVRALNDRQKIKDIWKKNTNKKVAFPDISYILESSVPDTFMKNLNRVEITGRFNTVSKRGTKSTNLFDNNVCDTEINATNEKGLNFKKSPLKISSSHYRAGSMINMATNYRDFVSENKMVGFVNSRAVFTPSRNKSEHFGSLKSNKIYAAYSSERHLDGHMYKNQESKTTSISCDCKMVPICHVKMLVANIEEKLTNAECTCDSLSPKICPVHSQVEPH